MKLDETSLKKITSDLSLWIKGRMEAIGGKKILLGISGGKDSSIVAALCKEAIGGDNVIGILMPRGEQEDIDFSYDIVKYLGIRSITFPIDGIWDQYQESFDNLPKSLVPEITEDTTINLPPRIRMSILYALSQSIDGARVVHTGNLSERWIGYTTVYGDNTGAFSPLGNFTSSEAIQIGRQLGLPEKFLVKPPADGLTGKTDEMVLGFDYETLNKYIRTGEIADLKTKERIDSMHAYTSFKFQPIPAFKNDLPVKA